MFDSPLILLDIAFLLLVLVLLPKPSRRPPRRLLSREEENPGSIGKGMIY